MGYQAVRFKPGRKGYAVILTVYSPNGQRHFIRKDLTKSEAERVASIFNAEIGN